MTEETEPARRGRPPNAERAAIQTKERRRKRGVGIITGLKLNVNEEILDRANFEYRFLNDRPGRIRAMTTQDDWELVEAPGHGSDQEGGHIGYHAGLGENNSSMRTLLARKPKQWYEDDQREKQQPLDDIDHQIKRGTLAKNSPEAAAIAGNKGYVPEGSISIRDGRRKS